MANEMVEVTFDVYPCKWFPTALWNISSGTLYRELKRINDIIVDEYFDKTLHWDSSMSVEEFQRGVSEWVERNVKSMIFDTSSMGFTAKGSPTLGIRLTSLRVAFGFVEVKD